MFILIGCSFILWKGKDGSICTLLRDFSPLKSSHNKLLLFGGMHPVILAIAAERCSLLGWTTSWCWGRQEGQVQDHTGTLKNLGLSNENLLSSPQILVNFQPFTRQFLQSPVEFEVEWEFSSFQWIYYTKLHKSPKSQEGLHRHTILVTTKFKYIVILCIQGKVNVILVMLMNSWPATVKSREKMLFYVNLIQLSHITINFQFCAFINRWNKKIYL